MAMSGIKIPAEVKLIFNKMKVTTKKDESEKRKMAFFRISDDKSKIIMDESCLCGKEISYKTEDDPSMFEIMKKVLLEEKPEQAYFVLYDFDFIGKENKQVKKLALVNWCPDDSIGIKAKMIFAATKEDVKKAFEGVSKSIDVNDKSDLDYEDLKQKMQQK